jgi:hypothetical protein
MNHFTSANLSPLLLIIDGRAGIGKSFIIQVLSAQLSLASRSDETILRCAPTGAASFGISVSTVHSLLKLPINKPIEPIGAALASGIQQRLARTKYLIIDEKSMISPKTLYHIDFRLQQAFATRVRFGGISILLFGDFWQLPPVRDKPLFQDPLAFGPGQVDEPFTILPQDANAPLETECRERSITHTVPDRNPRLTPEDEHGIMLYQSFDRSIELVVQKRQDAAQVGFAAALEGIRNSRVTKTHWETLTSRC